jgi:hypothetical protein
MEILSNIGAHLAWLLGRLGRLQHAAILHTARGITTFLRSVVPHGLGVRWVDVPAGIVFGIIKVTLKG